MTDQFELEIDGVSFVLKSLILSTGYSPWVRSFAYSISRIQGISLLVLCKRMESDCSLNMREHIQFMRIIREVPGSHS